VPETKARTNLPPNPARGDLAQWDGYEWRRLHATGNRQIPIYNLPTHMFVPQTLQPGDVGTSVATGWNRLFVTSAGRALLTADMSPLNVLVETGGSGAKVLTLPPPAGCNVLLLIVVTSSGTLTVNTNAGEALQMPDGTRPTTKVLPALYDQLLLLSDGIDWVVINDTAIFTTDGDILFRSGGHSARLPVGSNGQVLKVAGGLPTYAGLVSTDLSDFNEAAQDAVGNALVDSATIDFTYNDAANQITAAVLNAGLFPAWTAYTPLVAPSAGTITSYTLGACRYLLLGKLCFWYAVVTITNVGTGSGAVLISLPFNLNAGAAWGRESAVTGQMLFGTPSGNLVICGTYNNGGTVFTNWALNMTGVFETT